MRLSTPSRPHPRIPHHRAFRVTMRYMSHSLAPKPVSASAIHDQTSIVFPNDLNTIGTLFGGRVLEQADRVAAVVTKRHTGRTCLTLGIDSVRFHAPARHGDILVFQ